MNFFNNLSNYIRFYNRDIFILYQRDLEELEGEIVEYENMKNETPSTSKGYDFKHREKVSHALNLCKQFKKELKELHKNIQSCYKKEKSLIKGSEKTIAKSSILINKKYIIKYAKESRIKKEKLKEDLTKILE